jgi:hypothetical protein
VYCWVGGEGFSAYVFKIQKRVVIDHEKWQVRVRQDAAEDARKHPACIYALAQNQGFFPNRYRGAACQTA